MSASEGIRTNGVTLSLIGIVSSRVHANPVKKLSILGRLTVSPFVRSGSGETLLALKRVGNSTPGNNSTPVPTDWYQSTTKFPQALSQFGARFSSLGEG